MENHFHGFLLAVLIELRDPNCLIAGQWLLSETKTKTNDSLFQLSHLIEESEAWVLVAELHRIPYKGQLRFLWGICARDMTGQDVPDEGPFWSKCQEKPGCEMNIEELQSREEVISFGLTL